MENLSKYEFKYENKLSNTEVVYKFSMREDDPLELLINAFEMFLLGAGFSEKAVEEYFNT